MRIISPCSRVLFEKLIVIQVPKKKKKEKKSSLTWNLKVHFIIQNSQQPVPLQRQMNSENR